MYITLAISKRVEYVCKFFYIFKKKINLLLIITSTCLGSLIFLNADKLIFEVETNNISVKNLISTRIGLLIFAFFFISLVLYTLNVSGIKKFSESSIEQYISWFFTALGIAANWMFYRFSIYWTFIQHWNKIYVLIHYIKVYLLQ